MQGPVVDAVLLLLLILFFGLQQRNRPQRYFRFWAVGWIFVFLSYAVWDIRVSTPVLTKLQNAADFDFMLTGCVLFLLSMAAEEQGFLENALVFSAVSMVSVLIIDTSQFIALPKFVLILAMLSWQICSFVCTWTVIPKRWRRARFLVLALIVVYGTAELAYVATTSGKDLDNWALVQVLLASAILYGGMSGQRSIAGSMGVLGFASWAVFYFVNMLKPDPSPMQTLMYEFWNFPKYFVGLSMILKVFEDATVEKEQIGAQFRELYEDFRLIYDTHPHPMWICDHEGKFLTANAAALKVYGYNLLELREMEMSELEPPMDAEAEEFASKLNENKGGTLMRHRYKNGHVVWVCVTEREIRYLGRPERLVMAEDVTAQLKQDLELSHRAHHDVLTGLPNRQLLADRLEQCLVESERDGRKAAILTIDVDHFKLINDTYGHLVGDECLKVVAGRLKSRIRKMDTIARTGGEEFMAVVSGLSQTADAEKVVGSLLRVFDAPLQLVVVGDLRVTVSVGVAVYPDDAADAETLRRLSDEALYRAKRAGRNRAAYACDAQVQSWAV